MLFSFTSSDCQHHFSEIARVCNLFKDQDKFRSITMSLGSAEVNNDIIDPYLEQYPINPRCLDLVETRFFCKHYHELWV